MSNYYARRANDLIKNAERLTAVLSGNAMAVYENQTLDIGNEVYFIGAMQFAQVLQYRKTSSSEADFEAIKRGMETALTCCRLQNKAFGYFLVSQGGESSVFLASEGLPIDQITETLSGIIPDIRFHNGFIDGKEAERLSRFGGVVCGDFHCKGPILDSFFSAVSGAEGIVGILALPMRSSEYAVYTDALCRLEQQTEQLLASESGTAANWKAKRIYRHMQELHLLVKESADRFCNAGETFWKTCIWIGSDTSQHRNRMGTSLLAALQAVHSGKTAGRFFCTNSNPLQQKQLFLPTRVFPGMENTYEADLEKPSLQNYISSSDLAEMLQFPTTSVLGFRVIELEKQERSMRLFDLHKPGTETGTLKIGSISDSDYPLSLQTQDLTGHVLVTGASGAGKTNTVMELIRKVHTAGIPALIIESSKKEYWRLAGEIRQMKIYSFGQDAELLRLNPLVPEFGVIIGNHIDSLLYAFSSAFEMEEPTRLALAGLLKFSYKKFGWNTTDLADFRGRDYPTIQSLLDDLNEYCQQGLPYGDEVKNNIIGSLWNRLSSLCGGMLGRAMNSKRAISGKDLCTKTVLIELDDLSLETKPFVAMLIMIKVDQYLRQQDESKALKNLVVLEEAHNIFPDVSKAESSSPHVLASRYFSNMLSQIRAYGTGMIIADQGPSQINEMTIANTKIKIIHGIVDGNDIERIAYALNLSDIQRRVFPSLKTGEAVVAVRGEPSVPKVMINKSEAIPIHNVACVFCKDKGCCKVFNAKRGVEVPAVNQLKRSVLSGKEDHAAVMQELCAAACRKGGEENVFCLLGLALSSPDVRFSLREKRRMVMRIIKGLDE